MTSTEEAHSEARNALVEPAGAFLRPEAVDAVVPDDDRVIVYTRSGHPLEVFGMNAVEVAERLTLTSMHTTRWRATVSMSESPAQEAP